MNICRLCVFFILIGLVFFPFGCRNKTASQSIIPEREVSFIDPAVTASIRGTVSYNGSVPEVKIIKIAGNPECSVMRHGQPLYSEELIVSDNRLVNAFVYIRKGLEKNVFAVPEEPVEIDNRYCVYVPHVAGAQVHQAVFLINSDPTLHNVNVLSKTKPLNIGLPVQGMKRAVSFSQEEVMVKMKCDVHPWMLGYIGVVDHPFFGVTGADGTFSFNGVPAGTYTVSVWHEKLGILEQDVTLSPKEDAVLAFEFEG